MEFKAALTESGGFLRFLGRKSGKPAIIGSVAYASEENSRGMTERQMWLLIFILGDILSVALLFYPRCYGDTTTAYAVPLIVGYSTLIALWWRGGRAQ